jgi:RNA polymerase sigma-54 factor
MLQMTSIELNELVDQELLVNPILEEVQSHDEVREISENILDQMAEGNSREILNDDYNQNFYAEEIRDSLSDSNGNAANSNGSTQTTDSTDVFENNSPDLNEGETEFPQLNENSTNEWSEDASSDSFEEVDFGREFQEYLDPGYRTQEIEYKEDAPSFEQFLTRSPSLAEHLEWQLRMQPLKESLVEIASGIIGNLDSDGRLTTSNAEIAQMFECSPEMVEEARQVVMQLEPVGCGAQDVRECLLVQLSASNCADEFTINLIRHHLHDLHPHKLPQLAKQLGCNISDLKETLDLIRTLDPYPGRKYATEDPIFIVPEIYIEKIESDYVIYFADDGSPRLRISTSYQQILEQKQTSKETRDFIREKMRSAVDLLRNIEHRRQTIYRVVECIVQRQHEFLDNGVQSLKPMMLKDLAEETGMHLSTISRVVNRKYAHTPQGVIELRRFFSEGMLNEDGEEVSTRIIKLRIKRLIEEEGTHDPITDDHITKILAKEGIKLSRRTVAKYRDQMQIPGSRERKVMV